MKGLILAGGLGTRLRPLTHTGAKQLVPVANKPILFYAIEDLQNAGIKDIGIIVGHDKTRIDSIKDAVEDGSRWRVNITYIEQDAPKGIGHAVLMAEDFINKDDFVVYLGDNMLKGGIKHLVEEFGKSDCDASILLSKHKHPTKFGVALIDDNGEILDVEEKPEKPKSDNIITGIYIFNSRIFEVLKKAKPSKNGEIDLTSSLRELVKSEEHKISSRMVDGWWDDTGDAEAMLRANHLVLIDQKSKNEGEVQKGASLLGKVRIGKGTIIKKGSLIKGPTIIGENCEIGPDTYIGPYTAVGDNTVIVGGEIESTIIVGDTKINFPGRIVNSLIGRKTTINSSKNDLPAGHRFIVGEHSELKI